MKELHQTTPITTSFEDFNMTVRWQQTATDGNSFKAKMMVSLRQMAVSGGKKQHSWEYRQRKPAVNSYRQLSYLLDIAYLFIYGVCCKGLKLQ